MVGLSDGVFVLLTALLKLRAGIIGGCDVTFVGDDEVRIEYGLVVGVMPGRESDF